MMDPYHPQTSRRTRADTPYRIPKPPKPISSRNTAGKIQEDDPRWNPFTMGNNMQGPHGQRRNYR